ncbi:hypothetical protein T492DRAFT_961671, partial [Pavlovales sp. CCMP2436]
GGPTFGAPSVGGSGASATPATGASGQVAGGGLGARAAPVTPSLFEGDAAAGAFGAPAPAGGGLFVGVPGGGFGKQPATGVMFCAATWNFTPTAQLSTGNRGAGLGGAANQKRGHFDSAGLGAAAGGGLLGQPAAGGGLFGAQAVAASGGFGAPGTAVSGSLFGGFGGEGALSGAANPFVATDAADTLCELRLALRTEDPVQLTLTVAAVATAWAERERRATAAADGTDEGAGRALAAITDRLRNLQRTDGSSLDPATASRLELLPCAPTAFDAFERHLADTSAARSSLEASIVELRHAINSADWDGCSIAELVAHSHGTASYAGDAIRREAGELREEAELLRDHLEIVRCGVQPHVKPGDKWRRDDETAAAETCEDALRAFDYWVEATDPTQVVLATDAVVHEAWAALERLGARCGSDDECEAWQRACGMARDRLDAERAHWTSIRHPWATLPLQALKVASARARAREARAESDALAATLSGASLACVHANVEERREMLEAEHALCMAKIDSRDVHAAGERLRTAGQAMQGVQRALEELRAWAWQLMEGSCPELLIHMSELCKPLSTLAPELRAVLVPGRTLSHYEPIEWPSKRLEPGHLRHMVRPYLFRGEAVVLKEYAMASAQLRRMLELQAVFVDEDGYSHCLKAYVQTQLYAGGMLRSWLERAHDALACDEHGAPSLHGISSYAFVKAAHARVAPMHVRALRHLLAALEHLLSHGVVHGDVELENALVELRAGVCADAPYTTPLDAWRVVLADFDLSREQDAMPATVAPMTTRAGASTAGYMSLEVLREVPASLASDMFSFGVCVLTALAVDAQTRSFVLAGHDGALNAVVAALCAAPSQRPAASGFSGFALFTSSDAILLSEAANDRSCPITLTSLTLSAPGLSPSLSLAERHFVCDECLARHVSCKVGSLGTFSEARGSVRCVSSARGTGAQLDEQHIAAELERGVQLRIERAAKAPSQLTEAERRLREQILTLACPRCGAAFAEALDGELGFSGCCALKCARPGCAAVFCAYCLEDCGDNALAHVARGTYPQRHVFEQKQRARRERMVLKFLDEHFPGDADSRDAAVVDVAIDLRDLGLDPDIFLSADARGH